MADTAERELHVTNEHGLHARPAAVFVQTANQFKASIVLRNLAPGGKSVNAKSILEVLTAGVHQGSTIQVVAEGADAGDAVATLADLIESGLDES